MCARACVKQKGSMNGGLLPFLFTTTTITHLAVSNAEDEVAGAMGLCDAVECAVEGGVKLQDITEDECERDAEARLCPKGAVGERHANLADGHLGGAHACVVCRSSGEQQNHTLALTHTFV